MLAFPFGKVVVYIWRDVTGCDVGGGLDSDSEESLVVGRGVVVGGTTSEEVGVDVGVVVGGAVVSEELVVTGVEEDSELGVTMVLDVIEEMTVEVDSVVTAVVVVTRDEFPLGPVCLFANSTKLVATSGAS